MSLKIPKIFQCRVSYMPIPNYNLLFTFQIFLWGYVKNGFIWENLQIRQIHPKIWDYCWIMSTPDLVYTNVCNGGPLQVIR